ncbi:sigma-70 family RNA polymerase sigma factor [Lapidilactobacillus luobeiensis]|uniref:sigma-70 family RNA polymerase sigma factor n=1 Tax=Lapidilactobacillus luobeiensis TaxID=2950371 RepID=UPI0021C28C89|nr:sigma-70 family RNA polymerase sigma factor [Lapidilactobacillus luobeiensis]
MKNNESTQDQKNEWEHQRVKKCPKCTVPTDPVLDPALAQARSQAAIVHAWSALTATEPAGADGDVDHAPNLRRLNRGLTLALAHPSLIQGAVKHAGIPYAHQDHDDFVQEAYFAFANAYQEFPGDPETDPTFLKFAYQAIIWRMTDLLRYRARHQCDDLAEQFVANYRIDAEADNVTALTVREFVKTASKMDRLIIWHHFIGEQPLTQIAREHQLSPRTLRSRRAQLRKSLAKILNYQI